MGLESRAPILGTLLFLAATGGSLARPVATLAGTAAPDSARVGALRTILLVFEDVQVGTDGGKLRGYGASISPDGLRLPSVSERSEFLRPSGPSHARLVPWAEIESIHVRKRTGGGGPLVGALIGGTIGLLIVSAEASAATLSFGQKSVSGAPIVVGILAGSALGLLIDRPGPWKPVYP